jgi:hypothetical protein
MNQCPQCCTQLIITYEIWTSVHNAALNSLLLTKYEPVFTMLHWTRNYLANMNQCPQCYTQLIITYEIWTSVHNAALKTHYYLRNMNQCSQCSTQLIITYEIWTSVHNAALNSLLLTKYEPVSTMLHWILDYLRNMNQCPQCCTELVIIYEIWTSVHGSYFVSNNELSAALWTLVHIS